METTSPVRRRTLPPIPRRSPEPAGRQRRDLPGSPVAESTAHALGDAGTPPQAGRREAVQDPAQEFVARLRASAPSLAAAAGVHAAVVREAVPPARHRRARCRVVLRHADGREEDLTFLGATGTPRPGFEALIERWLASTAAHDPSWTIADADADGGRAIDLTVWSARA